MCYLHCEFNSRVHLLTNLPFVYQNPRVQTTIPGRVSLSDVTFPSSIQDELSDVKAVLKASIEDKLCPENVSSCEALVTEVEEKSSGGIDALFKLVVDAPCATSDCSYSNSAASDLHEQVLSALQQSVSNGSLLAAVKATANEASVNSFANAGVQSGSLEGAIDVSPLIL